MVTDRGRSDDAHAFDDVTQQKGVGAISCARSAMCVASKKGRARDFGERLQGAGAGRGAAVADGSCRGGGLTSLGRHNACGTPSPIICGLAS